MTATALPTQILTDDMLDRFASRAAEYDRENRFFAEDFEELRQAGYLLAAVPVEFGGLGYSLADICKEQRRLAYRSPATALATNMHIYWTGLAADMRRMGDDSLTWLLEEAAAGEVFAAGHGESGNDMPLLLSTAHAKPGEGGYTFSGHKIFGSLTPVWTRLGIHAMDTTDPANPKIVHAFLPRDARGYAIVETWDTLGMRATRSDDTILDGAFVPDRYIARVVPAGFAGADLFVLGIFAWAEPTFASVYLAIARRAIDLATASLRKKTSIALGGRSLAYHPMYQHTVGDMFVLLEGAEAHVERIAQDWSDGVDHGGLWPAKLVAAKYHAVEAAKKVVDLAMDCSGGTGMFKANELERIYRDVRCGGFHPANSALMHEITGKTALGVLGEEPRW
jgi:alkylation response protein AidB-like acyl-CoA dehydrogenase